MLSYKVFSNQKILENKGIKIQPKLSLLVGFYNNIPFFDALMPTMEYQTFKNFELVILDDGSKPEVVNHIHNYMKNSNLLIRHMWQVDEGWRKPELINKALLCCDTDYFILIDQDCLLHPEFVKEHFENREPRTVLAGRRAELSPFLTKLITPEKIRKGFIQKNYWWMLLFMFFRKNNQWDKGVYFKKGVLRDFFNRKKRALVGCNISFNKEDLLKINGFDMSYKQSCGSEDSDVEFRLKLDGVKIKPVCHSAIQYHMYHPFRQINGDLPEIFKNHILQNNKYATTGINTLSKVETTYL